VDRRLVAVHIPYSGHVKMWDVPEDFSQDEMKLFVELCANGVMSQLEAEACVRLLRQ
jgi:hypothetical protein